MSKYPYRSLISVNHPRIDEIKSVAKRKNIKYYMVFDRGYFVCFLTNKLQSTRLSHWLRSSGHKNPQH